MTDGLDELLAGVSELDVTIAGRNGEVRADVGRESRKGVPEVILADRKRPADALAATLALLNARGRAILSRVPEDLEAALRVEHADCRIEVYDAARMVILKRPSFEPPPAGGVVGVLTAGTSDIPTAQEAEVVAREMGCHVVAAYDVGVAGIHRLAAPLRQFRAEQVDVIVVAAGMDGALPSVVSGLVDVPVIGLPTPIGYGLGGNGVAALMTMLQSCAPGLTVVNIGNGVGAGATAALTANRVAAARRGAWANVSATGSIGADETATGTTP
ncbi:MAG: nickel pincer cofactor biosynthesis protein LarB [Chloroflexota bacterium]|nr:nickel pincer cofactor biosynthesis protein LarB [Chloroflexota bacterium]